MSLSTRLFWIDGEWFDDTSTIPITNYFLFWISQKGQNSISNLSRTITSWIKIIGQLDFHWTSQDCLITDPPGCLVPTIKAN